MRGASGRGYWCETAHAGRETAHAGREPARAGTGAGARQRRTLIKRVVGVWVSPKEVPTHKNSGLPLNAYMLHNLAHVELNTIDLAWDTVARFALLCDVLSDEFFADFARVTDDESRHFAWCS
uniref:DUF455 family protein n=1 Tax=Ananas comosus var. bracteatus TaxID=296719 RepID=A0A6V7Q6G5_ANACO|nr:unnamed protein product [Ananas comosus var. bracteatus]